MKKIIRLTESDLTRIVRRVINEERKCGCADGMKFDDIDSKGYALIFCEEMPLEIQKKVMDLFSQWQTATQGWDNTEVLDSLINQINDFKVYVGLNDLVKKSEGKGIREYSRSFHGFDSKHTLLPKLSKLMKQYC